jgi:hypothetical protein
MTTDPALARADTSRESLAFGLGLAALAAWVVAVIFAGDDDDGAGWLWIVMAGLGLGALVAGLRAGAGRPRGRALFATIVGGVLVLLFLGFVIAGD